MDTPRGQKRRISCRSTPRWSSTSSSAEEQLGQVLRGRTQAVQGIAILHTMAHSINPGLPYSADPMPDDLRNSMVPVTIVAIVSMLCTGSLLLYLLSTYPRARTMRRNFTPQYQNVILIFNLLLGDFIQSLGFGFDSTWLLQRRVYLGIACNTQGTLIQVGDMVGSLFVMSIAVHTFTYVVLRKSITKITFISWITTVWVISLVSGIGLPLIVSSYRDNGEYYWTLAGSWCWIRVDYSAERLLTHYIFIFFDQIVCISVYLAIYIKLAVINRKRGANLGSTTNGKVQKAARLMIIYPLAYVFCTLPLAAIRVHTMLGGHPSLRISALFGAIFASSGLVNTVLYGVTRTLRRNRRNTIVPGGATGPHQKLSEFEPLRFAPQYAVTATIKSEGGHRKSKSGPKLSLPFMEKPPSRGNCLDSIQVRSETVMKSEPLPPIVIECDKSFSKDISDDLEMDETAAFAKKFHLTDLET